MSSLKRGVLAAVAMVLVSVCVEAQHAARLSYRDLLQRLVDPTWLWQRPAPGERCVQFSSYDRACGTDPTAEAWFANDDRGHYLRVVERDGKREHVMVDVDGPGCLARLWSANPAGTIHFDIDGIRIWSVDFAALCRGAVEGAPAPLAGMWSRGGNLYLPVPFSRHLTISAEAGDLYYLADVVQFAPGTEVDPFSRALLANEAERVDVVAQEIVRTGDMPMWRSAGAGQPRIQKQRIGAGNTVRRFVVVFGTPPDGVSLWDHLGPVLLVVRCGDEETVRVPLRDFFGAGPDWQLVRNRFLHCTASHGECWLPMPMPDGGVLELVGAEGLGDTTPRFEDIEVDELEVDADAPPLLFRAAYHMVKGTPTRPMSEHLVLDAKGTGRFVGCSLLVRNPSRIWWGEGDEKFWVDGESFPSWFGTGTEDYFGYAWCDPTPFQAPLHGQVSCEGPMTYGFTQLHRFHALDSVPFQSSFRFDLERWHWVEDLAIDYSTVAYWYGAAGATSGLPPVPPLAERDLPRLTPPKMFVASDAIEGETLRVLSCSGGRHEVQNLAFFEGRFSRDAHRWWRDGKPGDALELAVPVPEAGRYRVTLAMVKANDFARVQVSLAGQELGGPFDGFDPQVTASGPFVAGEVTLERGDAALRFAIVGKHEQAKQGYMVGLDYLQLEKVE